jgi:type VI secretion system ImpA family protein
MRYRDLLQDALSKRTKDVELALYLIEANVRVHHFAGLRDGFWMLRSLIQLFARDGLHPAPDDGDLEIQYGKLDWLNDKLPDVVCEIPLTVRADEGQNYSLNYWRESRRPGGIITTAEFDEAANADPVEAYKDLRATIEETRSELKSLKETAEKFYGNEVSSFSNTEEVLNECMAAVQGILHKRQSGDDRNIKKTPPGSDMVSPGTVVPPVPMPNNQDAWNKCEQMASRGEIDGALAAMTRLSAAEPNGRIRFHRRLLLADLCFQSNRKKLPTSILQELNEMIGLHKLETWEAADVVGGVWSRLVRCYRDRLAGTADENLESAFYLKLSRLDPWQAVACGEPKKEN